MIKDKAWKEPGNKANMIVSNMCRVICCDMLSQAQYDASQLPQAPSPVLVVESPVTSG